MGFTNLYYKIYLPSWFILTLAYIVVFIGDIYSYITGTPKHIVNYKLKLNPFAVKMLMIDRYILYIYIVYMCVHIVCIYCLYMYVCMLCVYV